MEIGIRKRKVRAVQFTPEQQRYIDEHYLLLPVDADGVPIHVGDSIVWGESNRIFKIYAVDESGAIGNSGENHSLSEHWLSSVNCRHVKPDPVKELLEEFVSSHCAVACSGKKTNEERDAERDAVVDEYAARIREAVEK